MNIYEEICEKDKLLIGKKLWERGGKHFIKQYMNYIEFYKEEPKPTLKERLAAIEDVRSNPIDFFDFEDITAVQDFLDCIDCLGEGKVKELIAELEK